MGDLTQVQLLPAESGTARRGEPDLTEQEIALIVTAGGGRYVGLLQNIPGRMETVILFASPQTETTLGLCMSRFNVEAVRERIAESDELFAKAAANVCGAGVLLRYTFDDSSSFHVRLSELFSEEMRLLLERLQDHHGRIVSIRRATMPSQRENVRTERNTRTTVGEDGD